MQRSEFEYDLPDGAIAQTPVEPRDAARLLDTRTMSDHVFSDLPDLLTAGDLLVVNSTRVRAARLQATKVGTGGAVEILLLDRSPLGGWWALVSPARRIRPGARLAVGSTFAVVADGPVDGVVRLDIDDESVIDREGSIPLPPYIRSAPGDPERYQTVYADRIGSAAAPTAGLHFTEGVLGALDRRGIRRVEVELRVGLGTFRPIGTESIDDHVMHAEWCRVPEEAATEVARTRAEGGRVVAVGTTTVRTLETFGRDDGTVGPGETSTELFLRPGSEFRVVDALVTNFHVPGSSLVVMLAGFMGERWREAYATALDRGYRFLSFGDSMYCERA